MNNERKIIVQKRESVEERIKRENETQKKSDRICLIIVFVIVIIGSFWFVGTGSRSETPDSRKSVAVQTPVHQSVSNEQINEMQQSYNKVLLDTLNPICVGCAIRNEHWVNVYVGPLWYELNKGQKTEFVNRCKNVYVGMLGARGIKIDYNPLNIFINLKNNEKIVAKWTTFGVTINE